MLLGHQNSGCQGCALRTCQSRRFVEDTWRRAVWVCLLSMGVSPRYRALVLPFWWLTLKKKMFVDRCLIQLKRYELITSSATSVLFSGQSVQVGTSLIASKAEQIFLCDQEKDQHDFYITTTIKALVKSLTYTTVENTQLLLALSMFTYFFLALTI